LQENAALYEFEAERIIRKMNVVDLEPMPLMIVTRFLPSPRKPNAYDRWRPFG
jgi:hypothetical protein